MYLIRSIPDPIALSVSVAVGPSRPSWPGPSVNTDRSSCALPVGGSERSHPFAMTIVRSRQGSPSTALHELARSPVGARVAWRVQPFAQRGQAWQESTSSHPPTRRSPGIRSSRSTTRIRSTGACATRRPCTTTPAGISGSSRVGTMSRRPRRTGRRSRAAPAGPATMSTTPTSSSCRQVTCRRPTRRSTRDSAARSGSRSARQR